MAILRQFTNSYKKQKIALITRRS